MIRKRKATKKKNAPRIKQKKVTYDGINFDSQSEMNYYKYLKSRGDVTYIKCHPSYILIPSFEIKSSITKSGKSKKAAMKFTPDFKVTYSDGRMETVDVKVSKKAINEGFPLRKKLWEYLNKQELVVVIWDKKLGEWTRS
ncbi:DUF1064 domain-containing protein [Bacillus mycoides]|uniref:DUF1064 domain-containing protein n=1 Tax=Bacillus mycoides TaxID=1405 RepID=UPI002E00018F|nr:DUF1064 domain-containing protein [Bacillus mycoides]MEC5266344.1 DUF1064 domain-containing protein [Bacillus mycoides]